MGADDLRKTFPGETLSELTVLKLIRLHQGSGAYLLTRAGDALLTAHVGGLPPASTATYIQADIQRRLRTARIALTAYRAGLPFRLDLTPGCFTLTAYMRRQRQNPWGSSRTAAVAALNGLGYGFHYVCPGIGKIDWNNEITLLRNNTGTLTEEPRLILAGESYETILAELATSKSSYGEAYHRLGGFSLLLSCTDAGAIQLQLLALPDYRTLLVRQALGGRYAPPPANHPEWDAFYQGNPFVVAADMDLHRLRGAISTARQAGYRQIGILGLKEQVTEVLRDRFRVDGIRVYSVTDQALRTLGIELHVPSPEPYRTEKGGVIDAPIVKAAGKG